MMLEVLFAILAMAAILLSAVAVRQSRRARDWRASGSEPRNGGHGEGSTPSRDPVGFSLYRPEEIRRGSTVQVVAYAHLTPVPNPDPVAPPFVPMEVEEDVASRFEPTDRVQVSTATQTARFAPSDLLSFRLAVEGCQVSPGEALVLWEPPFQAVPFRVTIPEGAPGPDIPGRLVVYQGIFVRGTVEFSFRVGASEGARRPVGGRAFDKVFPSYSHRDSTIVDYVEEAARTLGHEFLRDVRKLRAGEVWGEEIRGYIQDADLFQLFWSSRSMASPYVRQEWEYALTLGRDGFVIPVYWEDPLPADPVKDLPPPALSRIHFHRLDVMGVEGDPGELVPSPSPPATDPGERTLVFKASPPGPGEADTPAGSGGPSGGAGEEFRKSRPAASQARGSRRFPQAAWLSAAALLILALGVPALLDRGGGNLHPNPAASGGEASGPEAGGSRPEPVPVKVGVPVLEGETLTPELRARLEEAVLESLGGMDEEVQLVPLPLRGMDPGDTAAIRRSAVALGVSYLLMEWRDSLPPPALRLYRIDTIRRNSR